jgi:hypothetical protein
LGFVDDDSEEEDVAAPGLVLNTLHSVIVTEEGEKCTVPIAICVSKSDQCYGILPQIAQEPVQNVGLDENGLPRLQFDGKSYNELSKNLKDLMVHGDAASLCNILASEYCDFNFFAVSAIGCECEQTAEGFFAPVARPNPKRIEEPILWLFKQFSFITSNQKVLRPFKILHGHQPKLEKISVIGKLFGKKPKPAETVYAVYEEDRIIEK